MGALKSKLLRAALLRSTIPADAARQVTKGQIHNWRKTYENGAEGESRLQEMEDMPKFLVLFLGIKPHHFPSDLS